MKNLFIALIMAANFAPAIAFARAGTLVSCDGVNTAQGFRYIGTYCVDHQCRYTTTRMFSSYCPYSL